MNTEVWFRSICHKNRLAVSKEQIEMLREYVRCLLEWNGKINLISRRDVEQIWTRHVLASIAPLFRFEFHPGSSMADIGTGGGLPGIPLCILSEDLKITLIDSIQKKIRALSEILRTLGLRGAQAVCGRVEELGKVRPFHQSFDYVTARGVGSISDIVKWSVPLLKSGPAESLPEPPPPRRRLERGAIVLLKGGDLAAELEQVEVKNKPKEINSYPVIIDGIDPSELFDKKIVIIHA
jgi:16S rRNA (guanine527-N7)-methyltransferase